MPLHSDAPIAIILNPTAGRGAAGKALPAIQRELASSGREVVYHKTTQRGEGEVLARLAIQSGAKLIVAAGGDGTLHEVANAMLNSDDPGITMGLLPFGTGNDFARGVGIRGSLSHIVRALVEGIRHPIDVGEIEGVGLGGKRFFLVAAGVGFVADTAKTCNEGLRWLSGPAAYVLGALATLRDFNPIELTLTTDSMSPKRIDAMLLSVSNVATTGGGIRIAPNAQPDDGKLDLCLVNKISKFELIKKLPSAFAGRHINDVNVTMLQAECIEIETSNPCALWIDGEVMGSTPAKFTIRKGVLPMMLPSNYVRGLQQGV